MCKMVQGSFNKFAILSDYGFTCFLSFLRGKEVSADWQRLAKDHAETWQHVLHSLKGLPSRAPLTRAWESNLELYKLKGLHFHFVDDVVGQRSSSLFRSTKTSTKQFFPDSQCRPEEVSGHQVCGSLLSAARLQVWMMSCNLVKRQAHQAIRWVLSHHSKHIKRPQCRHYPKEWYAEADASNPCWGLGKVSKIAGKLFGGQAKQVSATCLSEYLVVCSPLQCHATLAFSGRDILAPIFDVGPR